MELVFGTTRVVALAGDLTAQAVDVVVNAANVELRHGGGVAAAIARAAGPSLQAASDAWVAEHGPLREGDAAVTDAGALTADLVVHVAGPVYDPERDDNAARLAAAVVAALDATADSGRRTVAFPAISAGIYGYPRDRATRVLVTAVIDWVAAHPGVLDEVRLVGFDDGAAADFGRALTDR
ncbi:macro domain-containing protein [Egicoccus halophilus]|uniref:O-acetyl-ADP-ribose deacetylase n=1 Tax=Egicoccus halophilus TaxID=1670830 RepID=A0A8J3AGP7_9ACTN|nr:macro domain-containing protein [Egicoccus halophilus]GGI09096.1 O-acetyl-ADP-ribose deacetylase [Egicoccus halophilus]